MAEKENFRIRSSDHHSFINNIVDNDIDSLKISNQVGRRQRPYSDRVVDDDDDDDNISQTPPHRISRLVPPSINNHRGSSNTSFMNEFINQNNQNGSPNRWSGNMADKLSYRWKYFGCCGMLCLILSSLSILWLNHISIFMNDSPKTNRNKSQSGTPDWFINRDIPKILKVYSDKHKRYVNSPQHSQSKFLIHEIPLNETQVTSVLYLYFIYIYFRIIVKIFFF